MKSASDKAKVGIVAIVGAAACAAMAISASSAPRTSVAAKQPDTIAAPKAQAAHNHPPRINLAKLPMRFERNDGQTDPRVKFLSRGAGYTLFITPGEAVLTMRQPAEKNPQIAQSTQRRNKLPITTATKSAVVRIALKGAASSPQIEGVDRLAARSNYFIGNDPKKWHTDVPNYAKVELKHVYPGIDLIYHGSEQGQLEYDFRLAPGADPDAIRLGFKGMKKLALDKQGDLVVNVGKSQLVEHAPAIYQGIGGNKQTVKGRWVLRGAHEAGFKLALNWDRTKPIVIDPVLLYSTYLGGRGNTIGDGDYGEGIAVDSAGFAYVTGQAASTDFPTTPNAFQISNHSEAYSGKNAFVAKLDPSASGAASLLYSTYLGGFAEDVGLGIAVDSAGFAYVTGFTTSNDFPILNAYQSTLNGPFSAFVAKLNPSASGVASLLYSTYLGGSAVDIGNGIAVDSAGFAYVTGNTSSTDFPTTLNAYQSTCPSASGPYGCGAAFVAKLNPSASGAASLLYSTYLGGSYSDGGSGIAVDSSGNAYVTGGAGSDFPTLNAYQSTNNAADPDEGNAFVAKLPPSASGAASLLYSTYLGGSAGIHESEYGSAIAADSAGNAYVTGIARSISDSSCTGLYTPSYCCTGAGTGTCVAFPTLNAYQSSCPSAAIGCGTAFVAKLNPSASGAASLLYSTYLGGSGGDSGSGIAVDSAGFAYVTGYTYSTNFPTLNAYLGTNEYRGFITKLNPSASGAASLLYSTYFGPGAGIAVDSAGNAYVAGGAGSTDFPTLNAYQSTLNGPENAFVAELSPAIPAPTPTATTTATPTPTATPTATATPVPVTLKIAPKSLTFAKTTVGDPSNHKTVTLKNLSGTKHLPVLIEMISASGVFTQTNTCPPSLAAGDSCKISVTFTPSEPKRQTGTLQITDNAKHGPQAVSLSGEGKDPK